MCIGCPGKAVTIKNSPAQPKFDIAIEVSLTKTQLKEANNFRGLANEFPVEIQGSQHQPGTLVFVGFIGSGDLQQNYHGNLYFKKTSSAMLRSPFPLFFSKGY